PTRTRIASPWGVRAYELEMSFMLSYLPSPLIYAVADSEDCPPPRPARMTEATQTPPPDERQKEDAELVQRMASGDRSAFALLYDRFSRPLYATALRIVSDPTEAQDILHDVFITLWEKSSSFSAERGTAFGWAVTLVR